MSRSLILLSLLVAFAPVASATTLVLHDSRDVYTEAAFAQVTTSLDAARVPYDTYDFARAQDVPDLDGYSSVVTTVESFWGIEMTSVIRLWDFVEAGGGIAVVYRGFAPRLASLFGFGGNDPPAFSTRGAESIEFVTSLMPGADGLRLPPVDLSGYEATHDPACTTLARRGGGGPAGWTCERGEGRVAYWNTSLFAGRQFRGLVLQTLALVDPTIVRPVSNWAVVYLDDFPSPASNEAIEPIATESGLSAAEFYAERWWPDMLALADDYDVTYTSAIIFSYNGRPAPPFGFGEWENGVVVSETGRPRLYSPLMAQRSAERYETALHGYNHQSLIAGEWPDQATMEASLRAARARWEEEGFGPLPTHYVPPMNRIDSVGVAALLNVFPEINTIASLYMGPYAEGQSRDFGVEPWDERVYALPRTSSGYILSDAHRMGTLNGLQSVGGWGHFVHPDEMFANHHRDSIYVASGLRASSEYGWKPDSGDGFYHEFEHWLRWFRTHYPWVESVSGSEAADRMRAFDALAVTTTARDTGEGREVRVEASEAGYHYYATALAGERLASVEGGEVVHVWDGPLLNQYVIQSEAPVFTVRFEPQPPPQSAPTASAD